MIEFAPTQPAEMLRRHAARGKARPVATKSSPVQPQTRNVEPILSLGDCEYFHFRGRAFGVPPLPWKAGQKITELQARAFNAMARLSSDPSDDKTRADYYLALAQLPPILWRHCRPTGKWRRFLRALHLHRNPFDGATDRELLELLDFFSSRRMKSGVPAPPTLGRLARRTS